MWKYLLFLLLPGRQIACDLGFLAVTSGSQRLWRIARRFWKCGRVQHTYDGIPRNDGLFSVSSPLSPFPHSPHPLCLLAARGPPPGAADPSPRLRSIALSRGRRGVPFHHHHRRRASERVWRRRRPARDGFMRSRPPAGGEIVLFLSGSPLIFY